MVNLKRCTWVTNDPIYLKYHDNVWGRPVFDQNELFEKLCLDGQQAGLSWLTILKKQHNYQTLFSGFDAKKIAKFDQQKIEVLLLDDRIVRNRLKINAIINNAKAYLNFINSGKDFSEFLWRFVGCTQIQNSFISSDQIPTQTTESIAMSKALKKLGFTFVGPTICYAFMQAVGMVNDHLVDCHCYEQCKLKK